MAAVTSKIQTSSKIPLTIWTLAFTLKISESLLSPEKVDVFQFLQLVKGELIVQFQYHQVHKHLVNRLNSKNW